MSNSNTHTDVKALFSLPDARLSEGITYIKEYNRYYWVDIFKASIYSNVIGSSEVTTFKATKENYEPPKESSLPPKHPFYDSPHPERIGVVFPTSNNEHTVMFGGKYGLGVANFETGKWYYKVLYRDIQNFTNDSTLSPGKERDWERLRSNDGNVCPKTGIIYVGVMNDFHVGDCTLEGFVCRIDPRSFEIDCCYEGIRIPNSINFYDSDIYLTDSLGFQILKITKGGEVKNWREDNDKHISKFIDIKANNEEFESPEPDGSVILATGHQDNDRFITAVWSTSKVQEYSMTTGELTREYTIPDASRVSCCCVGPTFSDLIATTASLEIDVKGGEPDKDGSLFKIARDDGSTLSAKSSKSFITL